MNFDNLPKSELMKALVENTPVAYIILDNKYRILYINDYFLKLRHLDKAEVRGNLCYNLSNNGVKCPVCVVSKAIRKKSNAKLLRKDTLPDGTVRYLDDYAFPIVGRDGKQYVFEIMVNRTEEMLARDRQGDDFREIITTLSSLLESKDAYTATHSAGVRIIGEKIAKGMNLDSSSIYNINIAASLHDIGKVAIPISIINKPSYLTADERTVIETHPVQSYEMLKSLRGLDQVKDIVRYHHERFDGTGYPKGFAGKEIPLGARIVAVADTYDAMTSTRSYRTALSHEVAVKEILKNSGTQFDPDVVEAFLAITPGTVDIEEELFMKKPLPEQIERVLKPLEKSASLAFADDIEFSALVDEDFIDDIIANTPTMYGICNRTGALVYASDTYQSFFGKQTQLGGIGAAAGRAFLSRQMETDILVHVPTPQGEKYVDIYAIPFLNEIAPEYMIQVIFDRTDEVALQNQHEQDFVRLIRILTNTLDYTAAGAANLSQQTGELTAVLAEAIGLPEKTQREFVFGAYLSNIGLIALETDLVKGTSQEDIYKKHPTIAYNILKKLSGFDEMKNVVLYHHENFSGGGYPSGLTGQSIPLGARIVAVAEAFCQLSRAGKTPNESYACLVADSGKMYDPEIVALLQKLL